MSPKRCEVPRAPSPVSPLDFCSSSDSDSDKGYIPSSKASRRRAGSCRCGERSSRACAEDASGDASATPAKGLRSCGGPGAGGSLTAPSDDDSVERLELLIPHKALRNGGDAIALPKSNPVKGKESDAPVEVEVAGCATLDPTLASVMSSESETVNLVEETKKKNAGVNKDLSSKEDDLPMPMKKDPLKMLKNLSKKKGVPLKKNSAPTNWSEPPEETVPVPQGLFISHFPLAPLVLAY